MVIHLRITAAVLALEEPGHAAESAASALAATAGEEIAPAPSLLRGSMSDLVSSEAIHQAPTLLFVPDPLDQQHLCTV